VEAQGISTKFEYNKQSIDGKLWRELLEVAKTTTVELAMQDVKFHAKGEDEKLIDVQLETDHNEEDTIVGAEGKESTTQENIAGLDRRVSSSSQPIKPSTSMPLEPSNNLHLFKHVGSTSDMRKLAGGLHKILLANERPTENTAYRQCPKAKLGDIASWLSSDTRRTPQSFTSKDSILLRKPKRRVVLLAKYVFDLFWPTDFEHAMTDRFWGALYKILNREDEFYTEVCC
jgi:hypothetical protein